MRGSPLFQDLAPEEVALAHSYFQPLFFPKGKTIFQQGDLGQALYLVEAGRVRLYRTHLGGQEKTLGFLGPGEVFGEMSLLDPEERSASAEAEEDAHLLALYRESYLALIRRLPLLAHNLARILARRLRELNVEMDLLAFEEAQSRVAYALLKLHRQGHGPRFRLRHQDLAALAGASRETVTRVLHDLKDKGILALAPGEVEVRDFRLLEEVAFGLI
ncbi:MULTISPECIES: Crp/Fnr family transcriptional regulator [Thermus]|jgi:CRP/FNR family cyclic AMP-dependent transcriptional regulator|uniref:Crp family transcriptional regulator n=1 Tax=Thermus brockianus TaxID=56956 RepID=A0A1J0LUA8_THEBO|nr:Crp/Fnr family transcriptional regulator [Thermus brockianus]APD09993.1 Crp family transcriptional regulator [Thermus brockianus]BDG16694.1 cyclic AMP receptor protein [Thermus brockianus]